MVRKISGRAAQSAQSRRQAFMLIALGVVFLVLALLVHPSTRDYPIGVLLFGAGLLTAAAFNPHRLVSAGLVVTLFGVATFLAFKHLIPGSQILSYYLLAAGLALLGIALMARRGYVGAGAVTPGMLVVIVGILEFLLAAGDTPTYFVPFMLSFWLPGVGLLLLGIIYLLMSGRR